MYIRLSLNEDVSLLVSRKGERPHTFVSNKLKSIEVN